VFTFFVTENVKEQVGMSIDRMVTGKLNGAGDCIGDTLNFCSGAELLEEEHSRHTSCCAGYLFHIIFMIPGFPVVFYRNSMQLASYVFGTSRLASSILS
jgi:hypothetical protein